MEKRIIVTITGPSTDEALKDTERVGILAPTYPDFTFSIEYRLDMIQRHDSRRLFRNSHFETIGTYRHPKEGGKNPNTTETERFRILEEAANHGAKRIDIELAYFRPMHLNGAGLILSHHDFENTPRNIADICRKMRSLGADVSKFALTPKTEDDVDYVLGVLDEVSKEGPVIGISMSELGQKSRVEALFHGAHATFGCLDPGKAVAGQLPIDKLIKRIRDYESTHPKST